MQRRLAMNSNALQQLQSCSAFLYGARATEHREPFRYGAGGGAGRGTVVGFGVGTAGDVDGAGAGVTVLTEGPAFVSPTCVRSPKA